MIKSQKGKKKDQRDFLTLAINIATNLLPYKIGRFSNLSILNCLFNQTLINGKQEQAEITKSIDLLLYNYLCLNEGKGVDIDKKLDRIMKKHKLTHINSYSENEETHLFSNELDSNLNEESSNSDNKTIKITKQNEKHNEESDNNTISISDNTSFGLTHGSSSNNIRTSLKKKQNVTTDKKETTIHYKPKFEQMGVKFKKDMIVKNSEKLLPASFNNEIINSTNMSNITNIVNNNNTVVENNTTMNKFYFPSDYKYIYENSTTKKVTYKDLLSKNKQIKDSISCQTSQKNSINSNKPTSNQPKQFVQKKPFEVSLKPNSQSKDHRKLLNSRFENKKKPENQTNININIKELNIINNNKKLKGNEEIKNNNILDAKTIKEINSQAKGSKEDKLININLNIGSLNNINSKIPLKEPKEDGEELNDSDTDIRMITAKRKDALTPVFDHKSSANPSQDFDERGTSNFGKRKFEDLQLLNLNDRAQLSEERFSFKNCINSERGEQGSENNSLFCNIKTRVINNKLNFNINDNFEEENFNDIDFKNNKDIIYMLSKNKDIFGNIVINLDTKYIPDEEEYEENYNDSFANKEISFLENFRPDTANNDK